MQEAVKLISQMRRYNFPSTVIFLNVGQTIQRDAKTVEQQSLAVV